MYTGDLGSDRSLLGWVRKMAGEDGDLLEARLKTLYKWTILDIIGQNLILLDNIGHYWKILDIIGKYWTLLEIICDNHGDNWILEIVGQYST